MNFITLANEYGKTQTPFFFLIDFEMKKPFICKLSDIDANNIHFSINHSHSISSKGMLSEKMKISAFPIEKYREAFDVVIQNINHGNSYLLNLTFPSKIQIPLSLKDIYHRSRERYKLLFKDEFTLFSPETFVRTKDGFIYSYPMKGTIDAALPEAREKILNNKKELWEHNTIVDLIRNDLSIVAHNIEITRYRFITKIHTNNKNLLQVSSEIKGKLDDNWQSEIGNILFKLLPAGSISGAPKQKTIEIIKEAESGDRGYFTGVFGVFDGENLDSAVNIRFIEKINGDLIFRSGGGITANSNMNEEYQELINKIYVPFS